MKKTLTILALTCILITVLAVPVNAAGSGSIVMSSASASPGESVTLSVSMPSNPGLVTMTIQVSFDTNVLQLTKVSDSGILNGSQLNSSYGSPYKIAWVDGAASADNKKTGTIATFTFKVKESAPIGDTKVSLRFVDSFDFNTGSNSFSASSGKIKVACKNHKYSDWSQSGDNHQRTCSICGEINKENHTWNAGTVTKAASCKESGAKKYSCTTCGAEKTETLAKTTEHKYSSYTKADNAKHTAICTVCQGTFTLSHNWNSGKVNKEATCQETGSKTLTCKNCSATKEETVPKAPHNFTPWESVDETKHTHTCSTCQFVETKDHKFGKELLHDEKVHYTACKDCNFAKDQQDHVPGPEATATTDQVCTVCNRVLVIRTDHEHQLGEGWLYDDLGHWNSCTLCDKKCNYTEHSYETNCQSQCTICAAERTAPHDPDGNWQSDAQGHWQVCTSCNEKTMTGEHTPGAAATTATPQLCTDCSYQLAEVLPHDHFDGNHSHICECGETYEADADCPLCREARKDFPWWILCIVEAVIFAGAAGVYFFVVNRKSKKYAGHFE